MGACKGKAAVEVIVLDSGNNALYAEAEKIMRIPDIPPRTQEPPVGERNQIVSSITAITGQEQFHLFEQTNLAGNGGPKIDEEIGVLRHLGDKVGEQVIDNDPS